LLIIETINKGLWNFLFFYSLPFKRGGSEQEARDKSAKIYKEPKREPKGTQRNPKQELIKLIGAEEELKGTHKS